MCGLPFMLELQFFARVVITASAYFVLIFLYLYVMFFEVYTVERRHPGAGEENTQEDRLASLAHDYCWLQRKQRKKLILSKSVSKPE